MLRPFYILACFLQFRASFDFHASAILYFEITYGYTKEAVENIGDDLNQNNANGGKV